MEFFKPQLTLLAEPDGEFTLHSTTLVPSQGFGSHGARANQVPANIRLTQDVFPVMLMLRQLRVDTITLPALRTHRVSDLNLKGKTSVMAFVCLEGDPIEQVLGSASTPTLAVTTTNKATGVVTSSDWNCWVLPGPNGDVLHINGVVFTSSPGYSVSLEVTNPQGINPKELLLTLVVKALPGNWPSVIVPHGVRLGVPHHGYLGVTIFEPDGNSTRIPVAAGA